MEATVPVPAAPAAPDYRAALHRLIDRIEDPELLRALWLLTSQAAPVIMEEPEPELSPEQLAGLDEGIRQLDAGQGVPFAEVMARLQAQQAA